MGVDLKDAKEALDMMEVDLEVAKKELIGIKKVLMVAKMDLEEAKEELNQIVATAYPHHAATLTSLRSMLSEAFFYVQINTEYEEDQARADRAGVVGNWHFIRKAIEASETFDSVYHRYSRRLTMPLQIDEAEASENRVSGGLHNFSQPSEDKFPPEQDSALGDGVRNAFGAPRGFGRRRSPICGRGRFRGVPSCTMGGEEEKARGNKTGAKKEGRRVVLEVREEEYLELCGDRLTTSLKSAQAAELRFKKATDKATADVAWYVTENKKMIKEGEKRYQDLVATRKELASTKAALEKAEHHGEFCNSTEARILMSELVASKVEVERLKATLRDFPKSMTDFGTGLILSRIDTAATQAQLVRDGRIKDKVDMHKVKDITMTNVEITAGHDLDHVNDYAKSMTAWLGPR
ncbi:hypothetical protein BSKO_02708 [Bryopsis sp. KO-2023]|nr:hypothetical protein BSKO_02708 [Bryopsis sp. KO-2023]